MSSLGAPGPLIDNQWSKLSVFTQQILPRRSRPRPTRTLLLSVAAFCLLLFWLLQSSREPAINYWTQFPSLHPFRTSPEDVSILIPHNSTLTRNDTLPINLDKNSPSFHVVIPARQRKPTLCRLITSAMILNYPPPTLINYGKSLPDGSTDYDALVDKVTGIYNYLSTSRHVHDQDFVLVLDETDFFFQLPPEVMIGRFQDLLRERNAKLRKKYGLVEIGSDASPEIVQKYSQRVLFGASKTCDLNKLNMSLDPGCVTVPQSAMPPDAYGWKTDIDSDVALNRPRWLNPGVAMGQVADLKLVYGQVLQFVEKQRRIKNADHVALTQMYGRQEYIRELERQRTSNGLMEWLYRQIGISDATNITGAAVPYLKTGARYEYGIGVDSTSHIFFDTTNSKRDMEWLHYNNITKTSLVQMEHGIPREHRLLLPEDLSLPSPFYHPNLTKDEVTNPPYNDTLDALPNPKNRSWRNLPLLTYIPSASIPALIHLDGSRVTRDGWWLKMWYQPWARALLRKYMRTPLGFDVAQSALLGGQEWWDLRGGKGGIWTGQGEWMDYGEVCGGLERDVFEDGFGGWGKEDGSEDGPVYNQFGNVVKGG
ncbi:glycosyltransferase domain-containing protein [Aspergillus ruber CBS 135680]|uniref:Uncharacterized protein n=1 Tax=Aspergillus ruber (strain CBS 135680) TaxID=1388766 RepID=A0A017S224_ASPRC|nr:uncharacterized protein EURHEDRAFT_467661 [Aspergillus ruber CBS 135680]EYE90220.1 hypothetical protein EURHEDRAFT_467661 [Aspergillus ruber CBS 135680]